MLAKPTNPHLRQVLQSQAPQGCQAFDGMERDIRDPVAVGDLQMSQSRQACNGPKQVWCSSCTQGKVVQVG